MVLLQTTLLFLNPDEIPAASIFSLSKLDPCCKQNIWSSRLALYEASPSTVLHHSPNRNHEWSRKLKYRPVLGVPQSLSMKSKQEPSGRRKSRVQLMRATRTRSPLRPCTQRIRGGLADGTLVSPPLEDLAPFLPDSEMDENMSIPRVRES